MYGVHSSFPFLTIQYLTRELSYMQKRIEHPNEPKKASQGGFRVMNRSGPRDRIELSKGRADARAESQSAGRTSRIPLIKPHSSGELGEKSPFLLGRRLPPVLGILARGSGAMGRRKIINRSIDR